MENSDTEQFSSKRIAQNSIDALNDIIEKLREAHSNTGIQGYLELIEQCEKHKKIFETVLQKK